jgi:leucyl-tRNA synthetase
VEARAWLRDHAGALEAGGWRRFTRTYTLLLAPLAPHLAEELWERLGGEGSVHSQSWPSATAAPEAAETVELPVRVDGRVRDRISVPADADEAAVARAALGRSACGRRWAAPNPGEWWWCRGAW